MKVKVKKLHAEAVVPSYAKSGDAGLDLTATSIRFTNEFIEYGTSLAFEIPEGYVGLLFPRSSISNKNIDLCNSVGVLDSSYRGEVKLRFRRTYQGLGSPDYVYGVGDRVGQLIILPYPVIELVEADVLTSSERASGGFGSSGA